MDSIGRYCQESLREEEAAKREVAIPNFGFVGYRHNVIELTSPNYQY
jgi:hypothetical protein